MMVNDGKNGERLLRMVVINSLELNPIQVASRHCAYDKFLRQDR